MRHKNGQIEQKNNQSNSNFSNSEATFSSSVPPLTDTNYEFLFNQLLEGVAHGWHSKRIVKFFHQLGERGQQEDWVAWLERFQNKISATSSISVQQMATIMMRLGELTQSSPQVQQIGAFSYQIGRQILFGDISNLIWEYDGADFQPNSPSNASQNSTETLHSEHLSSNSSELAVEVSQSTTENLVPDLHLDNISNNIPELPVVESDLEVSQSTTENLAPDLLLNNTSSDFLETLVGNTELKTPESNTENISSELHLDNTSKNSQTIDQAPFDNQHPNSSISTNDNLDKPDWQELMGMIQEHEKLVKKISEKLNISSIDTAISSDSQQEQLDKSDDNHLDNSVMELVESWFNLGLKQVSTGDFSGAIDSWEKALNLNPNLSEAWHNRGSALGRLGRYEEAIESFERSLFVDPNNYQAWNDRAHALYQLQKWQEATESWDKAIEIMPGNHLFWYNRGCALEQLNNIDESIASYEKALEIKPDFQPARSRYINLVADKSPPN